MPRQSPKWPTLALQDNIRKRRLSLRLQKKPRPVKREARQLQRSPPPVTMTTQLSKLFS